MNEPMLEPDEVIDSVPPLKPKAGGVPSSVSRSSVVFARLLVGLIILVCAEVFSGASIQLGLWNPWTLVVTYWLYFAHFFFFTTLAVRTGRTSLGSLYLWGVLFGLYEFWITKVIWNGYGGDGKFVMGTIGPYGYSEISMAFIFHPVASFLLPLAVTCLLCPPLRRLFPDLAWFTGKGKIARATQIYLVISLACVLAMNSGGPVNLALNVAFVLVLLLVLSRLARPALEASDGLGIVVFGHRGFVGLCMYLMLLYGVTYPLMRPDGLPSVPVQMFTFVFYALAIVGIWLSRPRKPLPDNAIQVDKRELKLVKLLFALLLALALFLSPFAGTSALYLPIFLGFVLWTPLGFLLTAASLVEGFRERIAPPPDSCG